MMLTTNDNKVSNNNSGYISDDISFSILSKLPVKSFKRFSCVCKSWSVLIQNPNFMTIYRNNLVSKSHPLYDDDDDACLVLSQYTVDDEDYNVYLISGKNFEEKVKLELPPSFQIQYFGVIQGSVNGILCIYDFDCFQQKPVLWNPATEEILVVPPGHAEIKPVELVTFIFIHGFGYDHVEDDYKIIQNVDYRRSFHCENNSFHDDLPNPFWEIYSLKSNSWRKIDLDVPTYGGGEDATGAYFNGVCHWLVERCPPKLLSFNFCNEVHFTTPLLLEDYFDLKVNLTVLNGNVATIINCKTTTTFQISILGEFGVKESWITLLNIELLPCIEHHIGNIFFAKENKELVYFDLNTGLIEEIGIRGDGRWCQMVMYKKNLHRTLERNN